MKNNIFLYFITGFILTACQLETKHSYESNSDIKSEALVDAKYSLTKDRAELDKLREAVPPEIKKQNDEKALMAEWMGELKYAPEVVREKFSNLVRKKRELFNKDMTRLREDFNKNEKKTRDEFLKNLADDREDFLGKKVDREKRADFFNEQDENRRTFFAEQREKRDEFESDVREKRKNFDDYMKEKNDDFNVELKNYTVKWKEKLEKETENQN